MENLLQLASRIANIQDSESIEDIFNGNLKYSASESHNSSDLNFISASKLNNDVASYKSSPLNKDTTHELVNPQDQSFDFCLKDISQSPIPSPNIELSYLIDDLFSSQRSELTSTEISSQVSSSISSDSGFSADVSNEFTTSFSDTNRSISSDSGLSSDGLTTILLDTNSSISSDSGLSGDVSDDSITSLSDTNKTEHKRPELSYVEMIAKCILASKTGKVALCEIYDFILKEYPYFENALPAWRISVRHHLSTCESFVKVGRVPLSRGFYWAVHSACKDDFELGIFDRKLMRKRIGNLKPRKRTRKPIKEKVTSTSASKIESSFTSSPVQSNVSPAVDCPYVPTTSATGPNYHISHNSLSEHYQKTCYQGPLNFTGNYSVYNRLSDLSAPLSSTPVHSYCNSPYYGPAQNFSSHNLNNNYYGEHPTQTEDYGNSYSGYTSYYPYEYNKVSSYINGQSSSTYCDSTASYYGYSLPGKMMKCNGSRYSPY